jgi:hypothetical protein
MNRPRRCIFCGSTTAKMSKEHIWSEWVSKMFKPKHGRFWSYSITKTGDLQEHRFAAQKMRVKCVCEPCNNNWMSDLETEVKPIAGPMILDKATALDLSLFDQTVLALWFTKISMIVDQFDLPDQHGGFFTPVHHSNFMNKLKIPPRTAIWIARHVGDPTPNGFMKIGPNGINRRTGVRHFMVTFGIGSVIFQLFSVRQGQRVKRPPRSLAAQLTPLIDGYGTSTWSSLTLQLWPSLGVEPLRWPPPKYLTDDGLDQFSHRIRFY